MPRVAGVSLLSRLASDLIINAFDTPWNPWGDGLRHVLEVVFDVLLETGPPVPDLPGAVPVPVLVPSVRADGGFAEEIGRGLAQAPQGGERGGLREGQGRRGIDSTASRLGSFFQQSGVAARGILTFFQYRNTLPRAIE